jgi:hypothetical protein
VIGILTLIGFKDDHKTGLLAAQALVSGKLGAGENWSEITAALFRFINLLPFLDGILTVWRQDFKLAILDYLTDT